jgi:hypothetical protein
MTTYIKLHGNRSNVSIVNKVTNIHTGIRKPQAYSPSYTREMITAHSHTIT